MSEDFKDVQRIVLKGGAWEHARHIPVNFSAPAAARRFLNLLRDIKCGPTTADQSLPPLQISLGFTRRGLEHAGVHWSVLGYFALKAPAFYAGAAMRAGPQLGMVGAEAPATWRPEFDFAKLDAVVSLHSNDGDAIDKAVQSVKAAALETQVGVQNDMEKARRLQPHHRYPADPADPSRSKELWVHFGFRDGLSRVGIKGWKSEDGAEARKPQSIHEPGEFLLGRRQDSGGNPWIAGPGGRVWHKKLQSFFRDGSFGVLHQMEQNVKAFEKFVADTAGNYDLDPEEVKAKMCGRFPDGRLVGTPKHTPPATDFDFADDPDGLKCPFGAHVRRMNPRVSTTGAADANGIAHFSRARPLLRRGLPYGPATWTPEGEGDHERGLMAQFFCANIEDQYEHLVGQWADRVPLGSPDRGGARDPFSGSHEGGDGPFEIPQAKPKPSLMVEGLTPLTRTRGIAYLFYPSASTIEGIAKSEPWLERDEGVE